MTEIINLGNSFMNRWLFRCGEGYCLIDTGYEKDYAKFCEKLIEKRIQLTEIKYIVITHMHADHTGFLKAILGDTNALLIFDARDKMRLEAGKNNLNTYISRFEYLIASRISTMFVEKTQCFPAVFAETYADAKTQPLAEYGIEFLFLKGHSECDLCLRIEDKIFCGDICMNGIGSSRHAPMWIFNKYDMLDSWNNLILSGAKYLYPGHGKPFETQQLVGDIEFWRNRGVLRLFSTKR